MNVITTVEESLEQQDTEINLGYYDEQEGISNGSKRIVDEEGFEMAIGKHIVRRKLTVQSNSTVGQRIVIRTNSSASNDEDGTTSEQNEDSGED